jgi:excisionase family DNA binding protein
MSTSNTDGWPRLLTVEEAAARLRLRSAKNFARFASRHRIPLIRLGHRTVRVLAEDLERALASHRSGEGVRP